VTAAEDVLDQYRRLRPTFDTRPWISSIMVASIDSAIDSNGSSGPLGNDTDRALLGLMRREHGAVFVGASTACQEKYQPSKHDGVQLFIASRHPDENWDLPLWNDERTTLVTTARAAGVPAHVKVIRAGADDLDLRLVLAEIRSSGVSHLSCEGGPRINATFVAADLFDEISLTLSPLAVGGTIQRPVDGVGFGPRRFTLAAHATDGDWLFLRYLRDRSG
jgi:riboflavin biosynthesis pyrimidine reductase